METEIIAATRRLLRTFPTITPAIVWTYGFERRVPYAAVEGALAAMVVEGSLECIDPFCAAYRRTRRGRQRLRIALPQRRGASERRQSPGLGGLHAAIPRRTAPAMVG